MESALAAAAKVELTNVGLFFTEGKIIPPFLGMFALLLVALLELLDVELAAVLPDVAELRFALELVEWCWVEEVWSVTVDCGDSVVPAGKRSK